MLDRMVGSRISCAYCGNNSQDTLEYFMLMVIKFIGWIFVRYVIRH